MLVHFLFLVLVIVVETRYIVPVFQGLPVHVRHTRSRFFRKIRAVHYYVDEDPPLNFNPLASRPGSCAPDIVKCTKPFAYSETFAYECWSDDDCKENYKCCGDSCFSHRICKSTETEEGTTILEDTAKPVTTEVPKKPTTVEVTEVITPVVITEEPTTVEVTEATTAVVTTEEPTTAEVTEVTTPLVITEEPTTVEVTVATTAVVTTQKPTTVEVTEATTAVGTTEEPTTVKVTEVTTPVVITEEPTTVEVTEVTTPVVITEEPTTVEVTEVTTPVVITEEPTTVKGTEATTAVVTTQKPTTVEVTEVTTPVVITKKPTTVKVTEVTTPAVTTPEPTTVKVIDVTTPVVTIAESTTVEVIEETTPIVTTQKPATVKVTDIIDVITKESEEDESGSGSGDSNVYDDEYDEDSNEEPDENSKSEDKELKSTQNDKDDVPAEMRVTRVVPDDLLVDVSETNEENNKVKIIEAEINGTKRESEKIKTTKEMLVPTELTLEEILKMYGSNDDKKEDRPISGELEMTIKEFTTIKNNIELGNIEEWGPYSREIIDYDHEENLNETKIVKDKITIPTNKEETDKNVTISAEVKGENEKISKILVDDNDKKEDRPITGKSEKPIIGLSEEVSGSGSGAGDLEESDDDYENDYEKKS